MSDLIRNSKYLSLVLRHKPEDAGVVLDESGWCSVAELLDGCTSHGHKISREQLNTIVADNDKKRFQFSEDGLRIRAVQGHSVEIDLKYDPLEPPKILYHGTASRFLSSIKEKGLIKGSRQHVHLSASAYVAFKVGQRHGKPVVIPVKTGEMHRAGIPFYLAPNGVWLVSEVPPQFLQMDSILFDEDSYAHVVPRDSE